MTIRKRFSLPLSVAALAFSGAVAAQAAVITLDFEGLGDQTPVGDFYNGGAGGDLGIQFSPNALSIIDADAGGSGNIGNEPSPDTVLFFLTGAAATLNVLDGFTTGFSFFYSAINFSGNIKVYDGLNATGNILAELFLPTTPIGSGDPNGQFNVFEPIGVGFAGTAYSIDFGGTINQIAFDNVTFGSTRPGGDDDIAPIPLPAAGWLMLAGLGGLGALARKRKAA